MLYMAEPNSNPIFSVISEAEIKPTGNIILRLCASNIWFIIQN